MALCRYFYLYINQHLKHTFVHSFYSALFIDIILTSAILLCGLIFGVLGAYPYMYKWHRDDEKLLPQHYKDRCREFMTRDPLPVHYRFSPNKYTVCEKTGQRFAFTAY